MSLSLVAKSCMLGCYVIQELVELYFNLGLHHKGLTALLVSRHRYIVSEEHLKRILKSCRLFRRKLYTVRKEDICLAIKELDLRGVELRGARLQNSF